MLDLKNSLNNSMTFFSKLSQSKIQLFYEDPTPEEVIEYKNKLLTLMLENSKDMKKLFAFKLETGKQKITGIRDGDLCFDGKKISSNEFDKEHYRADWKELLVKNHNGAKLVLALVDAVFGDDSVFAVKDESLPFDKNSVN